MVHTTSKLLERGLPLAVAKKTLLMLHGRGASAQDILQLSSDLELDEFHLYAPQATNHTWYPMSFMAPAEQNEPWLGSAIGVIDEIVRNIMNSGLKSEQIYFLGFSQGACLALEYAARNARLWGGVIAFSGGLIGNTLHEENYPGKFHETPIFIGNSDVDPHIPLKRCQDSATILTRMGAKVNMVIYPGMGHYVNRHEIAEANALLKK